MVREPRRMDGSPTKFVERRHLLELKVHFKAKHSCMTEAGTEKVKEIFLDDSHITRYLSWFLTRRSRLSVDRGLLYASKRGSL